jgi:hypothetical protein
MTSRMDLTGRRISVLGVTALSFLCAGCVSLLGIKDSKASRALTSATPPGPDEPIRPGAFGAADAKLPARDLVSAVMTGTASDRHSDLESIAANGGKSAATGSPVTPPAAGTPLTEGTDAPGAAGDEIAPDKGIATATRHIGRVEAESALGAISIFDPNARPGGTDNAINGSDPDLIGGR